MGDQRSLSPQNRKPLFARGSAIVANFHGGVKSEYQTRGEGREEGKRGKKEKKQGGRANSSLCFDKDEIRACERVEDGPEAVDVSQVASKRTSVVPNAKGPRISVRKYVGTRKKHESSHASGHEPRHQRRNEKCEDAPRTK
ncbi:hypothetical protein HZH66_001619 [Vespula vulgaris]|uniref:Uncharacterized protein n=1 Tax=Vespula vulgaris TaxID=7454 RepID=A0A834KTK0_VESVU|nr:hypothetical protein HZH66_001619 [Vespula vulgaris]